MSQDFDEKGKEFSANCFDAQDARRENLSLVSLLQQNDKIPFHMPGHKRNGKFDYLFGTEQIDVTEIDGTDNLHNPQGILKDAMQNAADFFGVSATRFLVNGSTCGILAGMRAVTHRGDKVVVARNCHKSVYNAIELLGLEPVYILPERLEKYGIYGSVNPESVAQILDETGAKLVVITSPTYEGVISDVRSIANVCHERDAILFVDEAHGAHLSLNRLMKTSARDLGADLVVNSLHKTMPSLTQTALIHVCSDAVDERRLDESLAMFETSSPSYVLMSSIDSCIRYSQANPEMLYKWAMRVDALRERMRDNDSIKLFDTRLLDDSDKQKVFDLDKTKLVFLTDEAGLSGTELMSELRNRFGIELEMASTRYAIAMTGAGDKKEALIALGDAIKELDKEAKKDGRSEKPHQTEMIDVLPEKAFNPCEIDGLSVESVDMLGSIGRVSAENVWAYPPGAPILVKGEIMSKEVAEYLSALLDSGVELSSSLRDFPESITVVKE